MYKIGDKVKVLHTDYLPEIPVGSIKSVVGLVGRGGVRLDDGDGNDLTFFNSEVEPYQESVKSTTMSNKYNLQVGDVLDTSALTSWFACNAEDIITEINESSNSITLSKSNKWDLDKTIKRIDLGKWKIVSQVSKMNDKIEVGDIVEILKKNGSPFEVGDIKVVDSVIDVDVYIKNDNGSSMIFSNALRERKLKLVSKAKQNMKEVIGYNIKPEFKAKSAKIALALDCNDNKSTLVPFYPVTNTTITQKAKDLGTFELWFEPVYKSSEVVVKLSKSRTATITSKTEGVIKFSDGSKSPLLFAKDVANVFTQLASLGQIAGYNVGIKEFNLGCQTFTIDDLIAVNRAFVDFK